MLPRQSALLLSFLPPLEAVAGELKFFPGLRADNIGAMCILWGVQSELILDSFIPLSYMDSPQDEGIGKS